jgi:hypothetical protein
MLEQDRADLCGPRYAHATVRQAYRAGSAPGELPMGAPFGYFAKGSPEG